MFQNPVLTPYLIHIKICYFQGIMYTYTILHLIIRIKILISTLASSHNHPGSIPDSGVCSVDMGVLLLWLCHIFRKGR